MILALTLTALQATFWGWLLLLLGVVLGYVLAYFAQCAAEASRFDEAPQPGEEITHP